MAIRGCVLSFAAVLLFALPIAAQSDPENRPPRVPLNVASGSPLRLYLTGRVSKRLGAPVQAKLMEPVFAFDREVIPVGTIALGSITRTQPVGKWQRFRSILNGDFTPLRQARVQFTTLKFPDGREFPAHTAETGVLNSFYIEPSPKKKNHAAGPQTQNNGILGTAKQKAKERIQGEINARSRGFADIVRGPNKKEKLVDLLWSKAPYHPQYWRRGTRLDAPLRDPLAFGWADLKPQELGALGTQPPPDSVAQVRLLTELSSATAKQGQSVEAVLTRPLFSAEKLVLPEGTRLSGEVVHSKKARAFHRAGQLRFNFQRVDLPVEAAKLQSDAASREPMKTQAILEAAEGTGTAPIKLDSEGGVQAKESKTRFVAPVISLMLASRAADNDAGRHHQTSAAGGDANVSGRTLGGGLGLGMAGAAISQTSPYVGMAFGYYGLAWSVYSSVVGRGGDVQFEKNAMMEIKFGARPPASHFRSDAGSH